MVDLLRRGDSDVQLFFFFFSPVCLRPVFAGKWVGAESPAPMPTPTRARGNCPIGQEPTSQARLLWCIAAGGDTPYVCGFTWPGVRLSYSSADSAWL